MVMIQKLKEKIFIKLLSNKTLREIAFKEVIGDADVVQLNGSYDNLEVKNSIVYQSVIKDIGHVSLENNLFKETSVAHSRVDFVKGVRSTKRYEELLEKEKYFDMIEEAHDELTFQEDDTDTFIRAVGSKTNEIIYDYISE